MNDTAIAPISHAAIVERPSRETEIGDLIRVAIENKIPADGLEKLVSAYERLKTNQSMQRFNESLADFQSEIGMIPKSSEGKIVKRDTGATVFKWKYAKLDQIIESTAPLLKQCDLSIQESSSLSPCGKYLICAGVLCHSGGWKSDPSTYPSPIAPSTDKTTALHAMNGALENGRRQVRLLLLGLVASDSEPEPPSDLISPSDVSALLTALDETKSDIPKFCEAYKIETVDKLPQSQFAKAMAQIDRKRKDAK